MKGKLAPSTFAVLNTPWSIGYMDGAAAIKTLGKKRIFFLPAPTAGVGHPRRPVHGREGARRRDRRV